LKANCKNKLDLCIIHLKIASVSVHGTLLYFISLISNKISDAYDLMDPQERLVGFSVLLSPSDYASF
jgi:hypothetical protein